MREWFEGLVGPDYALAAMIAAAAIIALIVFFIVWRLLRGSGTGTYVAGGRNRKARLAVMDATAIDNYRRLVLVRRDDVEHLILIGGSADVVVESNIRQGGAPTRQEPISEPIYDQPGPVADRIPAQAPQPAAPQPSSPMSPPPAPVMRPAPERTVVPPRPVSRPAPAPVRSEPVIQPAPRPPVRPLTPPPPPVRAQSVDDAFDDDLLRELEQGLDDVQPAKPQRKPLSIDDEMSKLLGELSTDKR